MTSFYEFLPDADKAYRFLYQGGCLFFLSELPSWSIFKIFWCCLLRRTVCILTSRHLKNGKEYRLRTTQWKPWAVAIFYIKLTFLEYFQFEAFRASNHTVCRFAEKARLSALFGPGRTMLPPRVLPFSKVKCSRRKNIN